MTASETIARREAKEAQEAHDRANREYGFRFVRALAVERAALDVRLDPASIRVLAAISYFMNTLTQRAWPSYRQISEVTGYSDNWIERAIKQLLSAGYIFKERRSPVMGGRALVHYGLTTVRMSDKARLDGLRIVAKRSRAMRLPEAPNIICSYCGEYCDGNRDPGGRVVSVDHVVPVSQGGAKGAENEVPACLECNVKKSNKSLLVFLAEIGGVK